MQAVGTDLFSLYGEDWIVLVDRYSGYLCAEKLRRTDTESVIKQLTHWFQLLGDGRKLYAATAGLSTEKISMISAKKTTFSTSYPLHTIPNQTDWERQQLKMQNNC